MSGSRTFDDDRWPDQDGHACCFVCGKKVDPRDKDRGTYTSNAKAGGQLPGHLSCFERVLQQPGGNIVLEVAHRTALLAMSDRQIEIQRQQANCAITPGAIQ